MDAAQFIPDQNSGLEKNLSEHTEKTSVDAARDFFDKAKERLKNINQWHELAGILSAKFVVTDKEGIPLFRSVEKGDRVRIDLPGPALAGEKFDWVCVENVMYNSQSSDDSESLLIALRPCAAPGSITPAPDHFFDETATSTFILRRERNKIYMDYHGRNEVINTSADHTPEKIRNIVVGIGALMGLSDLQWKSLVKGIIND